MKPIVLKLEPQILDFIGNVLAERPYKEVKGILDTIVNQANNPEIQGLVDRLPPVKDMTTEQLAATAEAIQAEVQLRKGE
jgi:hypothetical protein